MKNNKKKSNDIDKKKGISSTAKAVAAKRSKKNKMPMYIIMGVLTFLLALTIAIAAILTYSKPKIDDENPFKNPDPVVSTTPDDKNNEEQTVKKPSPDGRNGDMYNLMVVGKDYWSGSTDVLMIVSVNTTKKDISVLQIPRDSTVDCGVNEHYGKRVNAIYAYAGSALRSIASNPKDSYDDPTMNKIVPGYLAALKDTKSSENRKYNDGVRSKAALEYLKETLKQTFCIAIDGYVMVDVAGFREIVDVLGGVEVDVPQPMHYDDDEQNLHIHLNAGKQILNGKAAEGFVRYRYGYVDGDIGRVNAQKIFLAAMAKKVMSFSTITKIQPLIETCMEYTTTDLSLTDIIGYVKILLDMDLGNIKFYTAPGEAYQTSSGAWYYSLYTDENIQLINEHFNDYARQVTPDDVTLHQVVKNYNISYNNQGITAEEIENSEINLTISDVTYNPTDTPSVPASVPSADTETDNNEEQADEPSDKAPLEEGEAESDEQTTPVDGEESESDKNESADGEDAESENTDTADGEETDSEVTDPSEDKTADSEKNEEDADKAETDKAPSTEEETTESEKTESDDTVEAEPEKTEPDDNENAETEATAPEKDKETVDEKTDDGEASAPSEPTTENAETSAQETTDTQPTEAESAQNDSDNTSEEITADAAE